LPYDFFVYIFIEKDEMEPPKGLIFIGGGDFKKIGQLYLQRFIDLGCLKPNHRVLDIGCGIGRIAIPLTSYLDNSGSYEGFDIVRFGIKWCQKNISTKFPNFTFQYVSLKNTLYSSEKQSKAKDFIFPYNDKEFDFIILTSVFTHMLPEDVTNYLNEIYRVLKPTGLCYATFFILSTASKIAMVNNDELNFTLNHGNYRTLRKHIDEANVAYEEEFLFNLINNSNLSVEKLFYGHWSGRSDSETLDFQDTVLLAKHTIVL
jgi:ubiquinone/menaquinone biosynthesis C-methylase UbiE